MAYFPGAIIGMDAPLAKAEGFFQKNGLDVSLVTAQSGAAEAATLASGSAQFGGVVFPLPPANVMSGLKVLGADTESDYSIIVQPDASLPHANDPFPQNLQDLKGMTIGISGKGAFLDYFVQSLAKAAGLDPSKDITEVALGPPPAQIAAFQAKRVQALAEGPPDELELGTGNFKFLYNGWPATKAFQNYMIDVNVANAGYVSSHPQQVQAFCRALQETYVWQEDPKNWPAVETWLQSYLKLTAPQAKSIWETYHSVFNLSLPQSRWTAQNQQVLSTFGSTHALPDYASSTYSPCIQTFGSSSS